MANILIIDDDRMICESLIDFMRPMGHHVAYALRLKDGLKQIRSDSFDIVFLDVYLPDGNGLEQIPSIRMGAIPPEIIVITGEGDADGAELAVKTGCWDYLQKPLSPKKTTLSLNRVLQYINEKSNRKPPILLKREGIIGKSPRVEQCLGLVAKASATDVNVLITGDTGTGKELFAQAIHDNSSRAHNPFVVVDCTALPQTLIESMLFGHQKGAFTGALRTREGLIKQAHGGTLFLDEVAELPMTAQAKFLRVLQEHRFRPVGSEKELKSNFRLIAATNQNLVIMAQVGKFRNDLFFRLQTIAINLPPLKNRPGDIKDIAFHYINLFCDRFGLRTKGVSTEFLEALTQYSWPGNVRELINATESALTEAFDAPTLFPIHLPNPIRSELARASFDFAGRQKALTESRPEPPRSFPNFQELKERTEKKYFQDLLAFTGGDIQEICRTSGLSRAQVYRHLKKHNLSRND